MTTRIFHDRREAGELLGPLLRAYASRADVIVLALPRGGVPIAREVARALNAPLDIFTVRKLGVPGREELAMGAIAAGGVEVLDRNLICKLGLSRTQIARTVERERNELDRRLHLYRGRRPALHVQGKVVILVDDGVATGASMFVAVRALRKLRPARIVIAVPVGTADTCEMLRREADEVICFESPEAFYGVGAWYDDFSQLTDDDVRALVEEAELERR